MAGPFYAEPHDVGKLSKRSMMSSSGYVIVYVICSDDPDAGLDEGEIVRVAHLYSVVAGDTVSRFELHLVFFQPSSFAKIDVNVTALLQNSAPLQQKFCL